MVINKVLETVWEFLLGMVIIGLLLFGAYHDVQNSRSKIVLGMYSEAVRANAGHYLTDESGKPQFHWGPSK